MKTVLVSGCNGYCGVNLCNQLVENGYKVTGIDKAYNNYKRLHGDINFILSDICGPFGFGEKYDYIYHLASLEPGYHIADDENYISTNIWGTCKLVKAFPDSRIVFLSTPLAVVGKDVYSATKRSAEHFINLHDNSVSIRFFGTFGEHQEKGLIPDICYKIKHGIPIVIDKYTIYKSDYIYIKDLVNEVIKIGESKIKGQTDTGYGTPISTFELYQNISKLFKSKDKPSIIKANKKYDTKISTSKFKIKEPMYGLQEGLRCTVRHYISDVQF